MAVCGRFAARRRGRDTREERHFPEGVSRLERAQQGEPAVGFGLGHPDFAVEQYPEEEVFVSALKEEGSGRRLDKFHFSEAFQVLLFGLLKDGYLPYLYQQLVRGNRFRG